MGSINPEGPRPAPSALAPRAPAPRPAVQAPGGLKGSLWYYTALAEAFARLEPGPLAQELARAALELQELAAGLPA